MSEQIEMHCPICGKPVTKVKELAVNDDDTAPCENEFYLHRGKQLIKIKDPKSSIDNLIGK